MSGSETTINRLFPQPVKYRMIAARGYSRSKMGLIMVRSAHSVAVDAKNNHIFVPLAANNVYPDCTMGCIAVYWHGDEDE